jgi:anthranilate synthase/aminodeoxychorismate synthase-like glutamine amidotransferase
VIFVVDNYDSFTWNLVQALGALDPDVVVARNDAFDPGEAIARAPRAIVVSPGPGRPERAGASIATIVAAAEARIPLLGVCLGHQAIASAFGGAVVRAPEPRHGKSSAVSHEGTGLFEGLPSPFDAGRYHSLVVDESRLPAELEVTARTEDGIVMALRHRGFPIHGVQFHPESVLTPEGHRILANFIERAGASPAPTDLVRGAR